MPLLSLILVLVIVGVLLYCINTYVPMAPAIKNILNIVVILCVVVWLLNVLGLFGSLGSVTVPRVH